MAAVNKRKIPSKKESSSSMSSTATSRKDLAGSRTRVSERFIASSSTNYSGKGTSAKPSLSSASSSKMQVKSSASNKSAFVSKTSYSGGKSSKVSSATTKISAVAETTAVKKTEIINTSFENEMTVESNRVSTESIDLSPTIEELLESNKSMSISVFKKHDSGIESDGSNMDKSEIFTDADFGIDVPISRSCVISKGAESTSSFTSMENQNEEYVSNSDSHSVEIASGVAPEAEVSSEYVWCETDDNIVVKIASINVQIQGKLKVSQEFSLCSVIKHAQIQLHTLYMIFTCHD